MATAAADENAMMPTSAAMAVVDVEFLRPEKAGTTGSSAVGGPAAGGGPGGVAVAGKADGVMPVKEAMNSRQEA